MSFSSHSIFLKYSSKKHWSFKGNDVKLQKKKYIKWMTFEMVWDKMRACHNFGFLLPSLNPCSRSSFLGGHFIAPITLYICSCQMYSSQTEIQELKKRIRPKLMWTSTAACMLSGIKQAWQIWKCFFKGASGKKTLDLYIAGSDVRLPGTNKQWGFFSI